VFACSAPVDDEPLVALLPDQPPEALHEVALAADQLSVEPPPLTTVLGFALKSTDGDAEATVTVADCVAEPPGPVHVSA
jgi:hypothetical protein